MESFFFSACRVWSDEFDVAAREATEGVRAEHATGEV